VYPHVTVAKKRGKIDEKNERIFVQNIREKKEVDKHL
jgi:hypothetical protein